MSPDISTMRGRVDGRLGRFYTGDYKGPLPSTMLCLFQAATISAVPPMCVGMSTYVAY